MLPGLGCKVTVGFLGGRARRMRLLSPTEALLFFQESLRSPFQVPLLHLGAILDGGHIVPQASGPAPGTFMLCFPIGLWVLVTSYLLRAWSLEKGEDSCLEQREGQMKPRSSTPL